MVAFSFVVGSLAPLVLGAIKQSGDLGGGLSSLAWAYLLGGFALLFAAHRFFPGEYIRQDAPADNVRAH